MQPQVAYQILRLLSDCADKRVVSGEWYPELRSGVVSKEERTVSLCNFAALQHRQLFLVRCAFSA